MRRLTHARARSGPVSRPRLALLAISLVVVLAAACGGGDDGEDESFAPQGPAPGSTTETLQGRNITAATGSVVYETAPSAAHWSLQGPDLPGGRIFNDSSPLNTPIAADATLHPDSARLVQALVERAAEGVVLATTEWTYPVFRADATTPRYDVRLTAAWSEFGLLLDMPIPDAAIPDPQDDAHLTVIDLDEGWVYDLWQARQTEDGWEASWGNRIALDSDGIYPLGLSARGSGFSTLLGVIWPHELAAGRIEHALVFSTLPNREGLCVAPATESDGRSDDPLTLPEGSRLRLDPALDLDTLNLTPWERTIARALQEYGMVLVDNVSASITFYAVHPASFGGFATPWDLEEGIGDASGIPLERLQLLAWGETRDTDTFPNEVMDASIYAEPREVD